MHKVGSKTTRVIVPTRRFSDCIQFIFNYKLTLFWFSNSRTQGAPYMCKTWWSRSCSSVWFV